MSNALAQIQENALAQWFEQNPAAAMRGIDEPTWNALKSTVYPGAADDSIFMAVDYCKARSMDIMLKPVHLVPMQVKDAQTNQRNWRDVPMPGIGMYRIQASRSGDEAGHDEPEFGPTVQGEFQGTDWNGNAVTVKVTYPEWCKYTVHKVTGDRVVAYRAKEFWLENYATQSAKSEAPNAMWKKRPYAQLAKCAEAQALRKGWPEIGQQPTAEEMEGKHVEQDMGMAQRTDQKPSAQADPMYPPEKFDENFPKWKTIIESGKKSASAVIKTVESGGKLTDEQREQIEELEAEKA